MSIYNDGPVLPVAIDRKVSLAIAPSGDKIVSLYALDMGKQITFQLDELDEKVAIGGQELPSWATTIVPSGEKARPATPPEVVITRSLHLSSDPRCGRSHRNSLTNIVC